MHVRQAVYRLSRTPQNLPILNDYSASHLPIPNLQPTVLFLVITITAVTVLDVCAGPQAKPATP